MPDTFDVSMQGNLTAMTDGTREMKLDQVDVPDELKKFNNVEYYENIFSWDMKNASKKSDEIIEFKSIDEYIQLLRKENQSVAYENGKEQFKMRQFRLRLIICFELYENGKFVECLGEIKDFVKYMETSSFNSSDEQCKASYNHILYSSYAFIATSLNLNDLEKIMKNVKPISYLNAIEKSAIHAIKALVFMKYPSKSKLIAFEEAVKACTLNPTNHEWINIWLITKGPLNREYYNFAKPNEEEVKKAEYLFRNSEDFWHLFNACNVFIKMATIGNGRMIPNRFFYLASTAMLKAIELAETEYKIESCLELIICQRRLIISKSIIEEKINKLINFKSSKLNKILGEYYFKHIKDYIKAEEYFTLGKEDNSFFCFYNLVKIKCLYTEPDNFPFIENLMEYQELFSKNIQRIKIFSQILLYCVTYEKDQNKLLYFLKLFMDQPFDNAFKYRHLNSIAPIFFIKNFNKKQFMENLTNKAKGMIKNCEWNSKEEETQYNTFQMFSDMIKEGEQSNVK